MDVLANIISILLLFLFVITILLLCIIGYLYPKALRIELAEEYWNYFPTKFNHYILPIKFNDIHFKNNEAIKLIEIRNKILPFAKAGIILFIIISVIYFTTF